MRTLGGYVLEAKIGEGGMGAVFRASHPRFPGHSFAVKVLRAEGTPAAAALARFERETQALARSMAHPHVVRLLGAGSERGQPYYVMELAPGRSLDKLVAEEGPLEPARAAQRIRKIATASEHAHTNGVLHRDHKPENVIVDGDHPRVCDFGLARLAEAERLTQTGTLMGTPRYAAPEQLAGTPTAIGPPTDVYALGGVLGFALTGEPPFDADHLQAVLYQVQTEPAAAPSKKRAGVPRELDAIVLRALEKLPSKRQPTARAFEQDLERFLDGRASAAPGARSGAWRALGALGVVALLVAAGLAFKTRSGAADTRPLAPSPDDGEARVKRALAALEAAGAPVEALGTGTVARVTSAVLEDLDAGSDRRAAWLAVDVSLWLGGEKLARERFERAAKAHPEPELAAAFGQILDVPATGAGFAQLLAKAPADPVRAAAILQRFLARCGAPAAIEDAALAGPGAGALAEQLAAREPALVFRIETVPEDVVQALTPLAKVSGQMRPLSTTPDEKLLAEQLAKYSERAVALATEALRGVKHPRALCEVMHVPQLGLCPVICAVAIADRVPGSSAEWLMGAFDPGTRELGPLGMQWDIHAKELDLPLAELDAVFEVGARLPPLTFALSPDELTLAIASVKALKRGELLEEGDGLSEEDRRRIAFEALVGMESFFRLSGPGCLPYRARVRKLALPNPLGPALARLDLLRAVRALEGVRIEGLWASDSGMTHYALACATVAPPPGDGRDVARELYQLAVAWLHEAGVSKSFSERRLIELEHVLANLRLRKPYRPLDRVLQANDFTMTPDDRARATRQTYEFHAPALPRTGHKR